MSRGRMVAVAIALVGLAGWTAAPAGSAHRWEARGNSATGCRPPPADSGEALSMAPLHREAMETKRNAPGARGTLLLAYAPSPYGLAVGRDGRPLYRVRVEASGLRTPPGRTPVAWAATPDLRRVVRLGSLGPEGAISGRLHWQRFLVFVTAEAGGGGERWSGPVLLVGRSPSSRMHTMRGHGIFEAHGIGC